MYDRQQIFVSVTVIVAVAFAVAVAAREQHLLVASIGRNICCNFLWSLSEARRPESGVHGVEQTFP